MRCPDEKCAQNKPHEEIYIATTAKGEKKLVQLKKQFAQTEPNVINYIEIKAESPMLFIGGAFISGVCI